MTISTAPPTPAPTASRPARRAVRWAVAVAAAAGTTPYMTMKVLWLTGSPVGLTDPSLLSSRSMTVLNAVTVGLELSVIALAVALTARWGRRLPAVTVLLPGWVATGLLLPMALVVLPATLASDGADALGMADWVRPMVYGGFAWQGVFLLAAFALYAHERWAPVVRSAGPVPDGPVRELLRVLTAGGAATAVLSAELQLVVGATGPAGGAAGVVVSVADAVLALAGAYGVLALTRGPATAAGRVRATVAGWVGSGVMFASGLWTAVTTLGATDLSAGGHPAYGLASLTGLLAGFALAAAGLVALTAGTRVTARP